MRVFLLAGIASAVASNFQQIRTDRHVDLKKTISKHQRNLPHRRMMQRVKQVKEQFHLLGTENEACSNLPEEKCHKAADAFHCALQNCDVEDFEFADLCAGTTTCVLEDLLAKAETIRADCAEIPVELEVDMEVADAFASWACEKDAEGEYCIKNLELFENMEDNFGDATLAEAQQMVKGLCDTNCELPDDFSEFGKMGKFLSEMCKKSSAGKECILELFEDGIFAEPEIPDDDLTPEEMMEVQIAQRAVMCSECSRRMNMAAYEIEMSSRPNHECSMENMCPEGQYCHHSEDRANKCAPTRGEGRLCMSDYMCNTGYVCSDGQGCQPGAGLGEDCEEVRCVPGLYCEVSQNNTVFECVPKKAAGLECDYSEECQGPGGWCESGFCVRENARFDDDMEDMLGFMNAMCLKNEEDMFCHEVFIRRLEFNVAAEALFMNNTECGLEVDKCLFEKTCDPCCENLVNAISDHLGCCYGSAFNYYLMSPEAGCPAGKEKCATMAPTPKGGEGGKDSAGASVTAGWIVILAVFFACL